MINSKYYNTYFDRLEEAQLNWKCWVGKPGYALEGIEPKMNMMSANMEKDFGLRVKVFFDPMDWDSSDGEPTPTYLLLPQKMGSTMTAPPLARFTKAVRSLKLEVLHQQKPETEEPVSDGNQSVVDAKKAGTNNGQPELTHFPPDTTGEDYIWCMMEARLSKGSGTGA